MRSPGASFPNLTLPTIECQFRLVWHNELQVLPTAQPLQLVNVIAGFGRIKKDRGASEPTALRFRRRRSRCG